MGGAQDSAVLPASGGAHEPQLEAYVMGPPSSLAVERVGGGHGVGETQKSWRIPSDCSQPRQLLPLCRPSSEVFRRNEIMLCSFGSQRVEDRIETGYRREWDQADTEKDGDRQGQTEDRKSVV